MEYLKAGAGRGRKAESANTRIYAAVGGQSGFITNLTGARVTTSTTAHVMTVMRSSSSRSTAASALAAAGTALVSAAALTDADGNAIASGDIICVKLDNSEWHMSAISGWNSGTKTLTLSTAIPTGRSVAAGAPIVSYGAAADTYHADYKFTCTASVSNNFPAVSIDGGALVKNKFANEPLVVDIDNGSNASVLEYLTVGYTRS